MKLGENKVTKYSLLRNSKLVIAPSTFQNIKDKAVILPVVLDGYVTRNKVSGHRYEIRKWIERVSLQI
jgi:hypothetical protein